MPLVRASLHFPIAALSCVQNPNVVGSGYIQFPPQRPFEKPVQVQPPTVAVRACVLLCLHNCALPIFSSKTIACVVSCSTWTTPMNTRTTADQPHQLKSRHRRHLLCMAHRLVTDMFLLKNHMSNRLHPKHATLSRYMRPPRHQKGQGSMAPPCQLHTMQPSQIRLAPHQRHQR